MSSLALTVFLLLNTQDKLEKFVILPINHTGKAADSKLGSGKKCLCKSLLSVKEDSSCLCLSLLCIVGRFCIYRILSDLDGGSCPRELLVCNSFNLVEYRF